MDDPGQERVRRLGYDMSRDGQIFFRPSCPLGNHSPQFGCPGLIPGGIIVSLHLQPRKIQLPTGQPRFLLWLSSSISRLSRATWLPHFPIPDMRGRAGTGGT